jgi:hypothetical protein
MDAAMQRRSLLLAGAAVLLTTRSATARRHGQGVVPDLHAFRSPATGNVVLAATLPLGSPAEALRSVAFDVDDRRLMFGAGSPRTDVRDPAILHGFRGRIDSEGPARHLAAIELAPALPWPRDGAVLRVAMSVDSPLAQSLHEYRGGNPLLSALLAQEQSRSPALS